MTTIRDKRSIAQLFGDSISELTKLVQNEIDLARAEIVQKLSMGNRGREIYRVRSALPYTGNRACSLGCRRGADRARAVSAAVVPMFRFWRLDNRGCVGVGWNLAPVSQRAQAFATLGQIRQDKAMATELMR